MKVSFSQATLLLTLIAATSVSAMESEKSSPSPEQVTQALRSRAGFGNFFLLNEYEIIALVTPQTTNREQLPEMVNRTSTFLGTFEAKVYNAAPLGAQDRTLTDHVLRDLCSASLCLADSDVLQEGIRTLKERCAALLFLTKKKSTIA